MHGCPPVFNPLPCPFRPGHERRRWPRAVALALHRAASAKPDNPAGALDRMLAKPGPMGGIRRGPGAIRAASERLQQARGGWTPRGARDFAPLGRIYRNLGVVAGAMEKGDFAAAKNGLSTVRDHNLQPPGAVKAATCLSGRGLGRRKSRMGWRNRRGTRGAAHSAGHRRTLGELCLPLALSWQARAQMDAGLQKAEDCATSIRRSDGALPVANAPSQTFPTSR